MADPGDHLSDREAAQLLLHPTADAVDAYVETSEYANAHLTEIGIDTTEMIVWISWVGGVLDPATDAAFGAITAETGVEIKIIPSRFSREDLFAAMEEIARTQDGVRSMSGASGASIVVKVSPKESLDGRPSEVSPRGKRSLGIPVRYKHGDVDPLATRQNEAADRLDPVGDLDAALLRLAAQPGRRTGPASAAHRGQPGSGKRRKSTVVEKHMRRATSKYRHTKQARDQAGRPRSGWPGRHSA